MRTSTSAFILAVFLPLFVFAQDALKNPIADYALAFPSFSNDWQRKARALHYDIWEEERIRSWAFAQGFVATKDSPEGGFNFKRGIIVKPPGLEFTLYVPVDVRGSFSLYSWQLVLDLAALRELVREQRLSSSYQDYRNILRYHIAVNGSHIRTVEMGFGASIKTPVVIDLPYIRDPEGKVEVVITLPNNSTNFMILYDAFLRRQ